jgi:AcrR family transcriptional regulator
MNKRSLNEKKPRSYSSDLRAEQSVATRRRILEAVRACIQRGDQALAYVTIAREARVSVPTVYRHFATRAELFEAIYQDAEQDRMGDDADVRTLNDPSLRARMVRRFYARFDDPNEMFARASRLGAVWEFSRAVTVPRRRAAMTAWVDASVPHLAEPQRTWLIDLAVVLLSSASAEMMRGYLDRTGAETADRVDFALQALLAHAQSLAIEPANAPGKRRPKAATKKTSPKSSTTTKSTTKKSTTKGRAAQ